MRNEEDAHLQDEHGLIKVTAYIPSDSKRKTANAERVARHSAMQEALGLVLARVPRDKAEAFKAAGSFDDWHRNEIEMARHDTTEKFFQKIGSLPWPVNRLILMLVR